MTKDIVLAKEKRVNIELLESALTIVIDDTIIRPEIIMRGTLMCEGHYVPEAKYNYKNNHFACALPSEMFLDNTIEKAIAPIKGQAIMYLSTVVK